jgi:phospholipase/lecithinase/hemolysin
MSKHRVLSFKPQLRLEWRGQDGQNETDQPDHSASLGDSITASTRIRFSAQTEGAQHIIVWDTPNLGLAPAVVAAGAAVAGSSLAAAMNAALALELSGKAGVSTFDIFGLGTSIAANPAKFGLVNVTDACGAPSNGCDAATAEYWDGIHPTTTAHLLIADAFVAVATVPEPSTWAMMILGFAGIGFMLIAARAKA